MSYASTDLDDQVERLLDVQAALLADPGLEISASDVFHHDIVPGAILAHVIYGDDVGMVEPGRGSSLSLEASEESWIAGKGFAEHLDRHLTLEQHVQAAVYGCHTARTDQLEQLISFVEYYRFHIGTPGVLYSKLVLWARNCQRGKT
jgi:hypothetical protein